MHAILTRLAPAFAALLALAVISCDNDTTPDVRPPDTSASLTPLASSTSDTTSAVPAAWNGAAIELAPVAPATASVRLTMDGGTERKTHIAGGGQDENVLSSVSAFLVELAHSDQTYLITPYRDVAGSTFSNLDPGYPQDAPLERTFQFTDPDNGNVSRITVIMQDKEWPEDTTHTPR